MSWLRRLASIIEELDAQDDQHFGSYRLAGSTKVKEYQREVSVEESQGRDVG